MVLHAAERFLPFGMHTGLMKSLVGLCFLCSVSGEILSWMSWIRADYMLKLRRLISRPLLGAFKLHSKPGQQGLKHLEMQQAAGICFLPAILSFVLIGVGIQVIGCSVAQATQNCAQTPAANMCPQLSYPDVGRVLHTVRLIACHVHVWVQLHARWRLSAVCRATRTVFRLQNANHDVGRAQAAPDTKVCIMVSVWPTAPRENT